MSFARDFVDDGGARKRRLDALAVAIGSRPYDWARDGGVVSIRDFPPIVGRGRGVTLKRAQSSLVVDRVFRERYPDYYAERDERDEDRPF